MKVKQNSYINTLFLIEDTHYKNITNKFYFSRKCGGHAALSSIFWYSVLLRNTNIKIDKIFNVNEKKSLLNNVYQYLV